MLPYNTWAIIHPCLAEETSGDSQIVKKSNFALEMPELNFSWVKFFVLLFPGTQAITGRASGNVDQSILKSIRTKSKPPKEANSLDPTLTKPNSHRLAIKRSVIALPNSPCGWLPPVAVLSIGPRSLLL